MAQIYQYESIDAKEEFRLIELKAGTKTDPLCGDVLTASFAAATSFVALSYAWGSDIKCKEFTTTKGVIAITESLASALVCVRSPDTDMLLWADAVCINQTDGNEKNHQVRRMRDIFAGAQMVYAYLGEEKENSELAPRIFEALGENDIAAAYGIQPGIMALAISVLILKLEHGGVDALLPPLSHPAWEAARALLRRPWFRRVWIIQEFTVAKNVVFCCGDWSMSWLTLAGAIIQCQNLDFPFLYLDHGYSSDVEKMARQGETSMYSLIWSRVAYQDGRKRTLIDLLDSCIDTLSTRARDHLFALLGVAKDAADKVYDPDYDEPLVDVVCRYAAGLVGHGYGSQLLGAAGLIANGVPDFPSWIPDWFKPRMLGVLCCEDPDINVYAAGGESRLFSIRLSDDNKKATVRGHHFDVITTVGMSYDEKPDAESTANSLQRTIDRLDEAEILMRKLNGYPTGESVDMAFKTTLISDRLDNTMRATQALADEYAHAREVLQMVHAKDWIFASGQEKYSEAWVYLIRLLATFEIMRFCVSENGYMGLVPDNAQVGDVCYVLHGMRTPYLFRRIEGCGMDQLRLVGQCYIHGIMDSEACAVPGHASEEITIW